MNEQFYDSLYSWSSPSPSSFNKAWDWHWAAIHGCAICSAERALIPHKSMLHIIYFPYFHKFTNVPYFRLIYDLWLIYTFCSPNNFDHDEFMHHDLGLHILNASVVRQWHSHWRSYLPNKTHLLHLLCLKEDLKHSKTRAVNCFV